MRLLDEGGYDRKLFKHWNGGVQADDGCDTREELMLAEAVKQPERGDGCKLSGGEWVSYYDVDHMVPLEESWSSGAWQWTADQREAYANDLAAERSLVAVTAGFVHFKGFWLAFRLRREALLVRVGVEDLHQPAVAAVGL
ncbi:hypothetical protein [Streptomyces sp. WMMC940]|uniref:hypothetical protein n=1 Tax=Streptomyces sp. WMMC940 TaxID=3015153 RepID=UPI003FCDEF82